MRERGIDVAAADDPIASPVFSGPGYDVVLIDRAALTADTAAALAVLCDAGVAKALMSVQTPEMLGMGEGAPLAPPDDPAIADPGPSPRASAARRLARPVFTIDDWEFRPAERAVSTPEHRRIVLTGTESRLLHLLASHRTRVLSRQRILRAILPNGRSTATVDSHVHAIRAKTTPSMIRTVHGLGYSLGTV